MDVLEWPEEEVELALALMADESQIVANVQSQRDIRAQAAANARAVGM